MCVSWNAFRAVTTVNSFLKTIILYSRGSLEQKDKTVWLRLGTRYPVSSTPDMWARTSIYKTFCFRLHVHCQYEKGEHILGSLTLWKSIVPIRIVINRNTVTITWCIKWTASISIWQCNQHLRRFFSLWLVFLFSSTETKQVSLFFWYFELINYLCC